MFHLEDNFKLFSQHSSIQTQQFLWLDGVKEEEEGGWGLSDVSTTRILIINTTIAQHNNK